MHFALIKASDLIRVSEDGIPLTPTTHKVNAAGFMIHASLHKARPDVNAACHTHSRYGRAWSVFGRPIEMLNQGKNLLQIYYVCLFSNKIDCCYFYDDLSVYEGFGGVAFAQEEGQRIAESLGPKNRNIILQNHG